MSCRVRERTVKVRPPLLRRVFTLRCDDADMASHASPRPHRPSAPQATAFPNAGRVEAPGYKWTVLTNTTLGTLMATVNSSILLVSLPPIFRGIGIDPLAAGESAYMLWTLMGYMVITAVLLVTCGRLSDMYGRTRLYVVGFAIFTAASIALALTPGSGNRAAAFIIVMRVVQGGGGAFIFANSAALLTDVFPPDRRGLALGINQIALITGSLVGLLIGGALATIDWRLVFLVSVPFGIGGTLWAYFRLHETTEPIPGERFDPLGNVAFAGGLTSVLVALTYAVQPYGDTPTGWTNPWVIAGIVVGGLLLAAFVAIELRAQTPLFHLRLFRNRMFAAGNASGFLSSLARGGLQFVIVIWLQGIWLPRHGIPYEQTPLWSGIYTAPLVVGFIVLGPIAGALSDRYGARAFASGGMLLTALGFVLLARLRVDFARLPFFGVLLLTGIGMGLFASPNTTSIMNAAPVHERGAASGIRATFQNAATVLSIAVFFSILTTGMAVRLPALMVHGLESVGVPAAAAHAAASVPPISMLFAAFLGYNPLAALLPPGVTGALSAHARAVVFGQQFFPALIAPAVQNGLATAFIVAAVLSLLAAAASLLRGERFIAED